MSAQAPSKLGALKRSTKLFGRSKTGSITKHKNKKQREVLNLIQSHNLNPKERVVIGRVSVWLEKMDE